MQSHFSPHVPSFPWNLHEALELNDDQSIVAWIPRAEGRPNAFKIVDQEAFVSKLLKKHFQQTKFKSFQRQLNLWGFKRTRDGGYTHEFFVKGQMSLCQYMTRKQNKSKSSPKKTLAQKKRVQQTSSVESNISTASTVEPVQQLARFVSDDVPSTICADHMTTADGSSSMSRPFPQQTAPSSTSCEVDYELMRCSSPVAEVSIDGSFRSSSDSLSDFELDMLVDGNDSLNASDLVWGRQFHLVVDEIETH